MLRPSISRGRPALGWADNRAEVTAASRSIDSSIGAGPTLQLTPTTSAPRATSTGANCSGGVPSRLLPSSSVVICATMGRSQMRRTAAIAALISFRSRNVSRMKRSTPPARRASACSVKYCSASSTPVFPQGSTRIPRGPIAPATYARSSASSESARCARPEPCRAAALRAIRAPSWLMSATFSLRPNARSLIRLAPKVLVSMMSAPARTYSSCTLPTRSGLVRLSDSKQRLMKTPLE